MPPEPYTPTGISPNSVAIGNANAPPGINTGDGGGDGGGGGGNNGFHNNMGNGDGNGGGGGGGGGGNGGDENYEEAESLMAQQPSRVRPPAKFFLGQPQKFKKPSKCECGDCCCCCCLTLKRLMTFFLSSSFLFSFSFFSSANSEIPLWMTQSGVLACTRWKTPAQMNGRKRNEWQCCDNSACLPFVASSLLSS